MLTPQAVETLFITLRQIAAEGCSILYISHKLNEIKNLCHKATILRSGRVLGVCDPRQESSSSMARLMIAASLPEYRHRAVMTAGFIHKVLFVPPSMPASDLLSRMHQRHVARLALDGVGSSAISRTNAAEMKAAEEAIISGRLKPFTGEIKDQDGTVKLAKGQEMADADIKGMTWLIEGVQGTLPQN